MTGFEIYVAIIIVAMIGFFAWIVFNSDPNR